MVKLAKDPAVLFYTNDFLAGTFTMSNEQVGKYIRLLCLQHQKGVLTSNDMSNICQTYDIDIYSHFVKEGDYFFNKRMKDESDRRRLYSESRKNNRNSKSDQVDDKSYVKHMETATETINENIIAVKKEDIRTLWIKTFGRNPKIPEVEETENLINKFGFDKVHHIYKEASLKGFKNLNTLIEALDEKGNIKPRGDNGTGSSKQRRKDYVTEDEYKSGLKKLFEG
jgi:hypothetical protein